MTAVAIVVGAILIILATRPTSTTGAELTLPITTYAADLTDGETLGSAKAPVVIELYADFQCPICKNLTTLVLPRLVSDFVQPGVVWIEARDIDILGAGTPDESLELAAGAACAAEQDRYWQFHDLVFWNQGRENRGDHNAAFIERVASQADLDITAWKSCDARNDIRKPITDRTTTAVAAGINSTPTMRINGQLVVGVPDYAQLAALINQLAAAASPSPSPGP